MLKHDTIARRSSSYLRRSPSGSFGACLTRRRVPLTQDAHRLVEGHLALVHDGHHLAEIDLKLVVQNVALVEVLPLVEKNLLGTEVLRTLAWK